MLFCYGAGASCLSPAAGASLKLKKSAAFWLGAAAAAAELPPASKLSKSKVDGCALSYLTSSPAAAAASIANCFSCPEALTVEKSPF